MKIMRGKDKNKWNDSRFVNIILAFNEKLDDCHKEIKDIKIKWNHLQKAQKKKKKKSHSMLEFTSNFEKTPNIFGSTF